MTIFSAADLLIPKEEYLPQWAVVACDQYTSQPDYWERVKNYAGDAPSTLNLILPEAQLKAPGKEQKIENIHSTMASYKDSQMFRAYPHSFLYIERVMHDGAIRRGLVGVIDLDQYAYTDKNDAKIRATEKTVVERIAPRKAVRQDSALDMSHVILLADDSKDLILGSLESKKTQLPKVYDFDLMERGGHITGWLVEKDQAAALEEKLQQYENGMAELCRNQGKAELFYAVGDGNHSLASAKACYEKLLETKTADQLKNDPRRYALVELENIHDTTQDFEPIHRIVDTENPMAFLKLMQEKCCSDSGYPVKWFAGDASGVVYLDSSKGKSAVSIIQAFLDGALSDVTTQLDYIHGDDVVESLAKAPNKLGIALPAILKDDFFGALIADGVLPRKTFSIGQAQEKRFYLETRVLL